MNIIYTTHIFSKHNNLFSDEKKYLQCLWKCLSQEKELKYWKKYSID
jgi:hypothetical protein